MTIIEVSMPGRTGGEVTRYLSSHGIQVGLGSVEGEYLLIPVDDPERALSLLERWGKEPARNRKPVPVQQRRPSQWPELPNPFSVFDEVFS
jgi:hypothetical protein